MNMTRSEYFSERAMQTKISTGCDKATIVLIDTWNDITCDISEA